MPPIIRQQVQPPFMQAAMQSQQPWSMSQQALSPLVHITMQPSFVISTLQAPIVRLQQHTIMPFIMQQTLHMPPAIMVQRFCIMVQAVGSSHTQVIFIPFFIFSIVMVQRGTITMLGIAPVMPPVGPIMGIPEPMPAIEVRSIIIAPVMYPSSWVMPAIGLNRGEKPWKRSPATGWRPEYPNETDAHQLLS
ncbi:MAG: hypothetical protein ACSLE1_12705 [Sphingobium sp.]